MAFSCLDSVAGLIVTLDDVGVLTLSYLGTDPPLQAVDAKHSADIDYTALDRQYRQLTSRIQAHGAPIEPALAQEQLTLSAQVICKQLCVCIHLSESCAHVHLKVCDILTCFAVVIQHLQLESFVPLHIV